MQDLYIGPGIRVEGRITQCGKDKQIVIAGTFAGDVIADGAVLVEAGGTIEVAKEIKCFDLRVKGEIKGGDAAIEAGLLVLEPGARVEVKAVSLPPGGLEQSRGSVLCAQVAMTPEHPRAQDERLKAEPAAAQPAAASPTLTTIAGLKTQAHGQATAQSQSASPGSTTGAPTASSTSGATTGATLARVVSLGATTASSASTSSASAFDDEASARPKLA